VPRRRRATEGLLPGAADFAAFPRGAWLAAARRAMAAAPPSAFGYSHSAGRIELRTALADYLGRVRGVRATPEHIVITAGFHHALSLVARSLVARGARRVAVEEYGLDLYRDLLVEAGLEIPTVAVDAQGARTDALDGLDADAVLLTPAHQFPLGFALSPERRAAARDWARVSGGLILEDDYDGEFRYDRKPVGALQGLEPERTVYFGTSSKSLAPALRVGWMVVPGHLVPDVLQAKGRVELVSVLEQLTLAEFIASGAFDRHVRARRQSNRRRREELVAALAAAAPGIRVTGIAGGLQAVLELPRGSEGRMLRAAAAEGVLVSGLAEFRAVGGPPERDALVVNHSALSDSAWEGALGALCRILGSAG
jgi:GntR family transcriptional regulator/MocR family aminotransferase